MYLVEYVGNHRRFWRFLTHGRILSETCGRAKSELSLLYEYCFYNCNLQLLFLRGISSQNRRVHVLPNFHLRCSFCHFNVEIFRSCKNKHTYVWYAEVNIPFSLVVESLIYLYTRTFFSIVSYRSSTKNWRIHKV